MKFPENPTTGEQHTEGLLSWVFDGTTWVKVPITDEMVQRAEDAAEAAAESADTALATLPVIQDEEPEDPYPGKTWVKDGTELVWVVNDDNSHGQWVELHVSKVVDTFGALNTLAKPDGASKVGLPKGTVLDAIQYATPEMYGAKGDGETPDDAAFHALVADIIAGKVNLVHLPAKTYVFASPTRIDVNAPPGPIWFIGQNTTFLFQKGTNSRHFVFRNGHGLRISGIYFKTEVDDAIQDALDIMNYSDVIVEDNQFDDFTFYGLGIFNDTIGGTSAPCNNIVVRRNTFRRIGVFGFEHFPKDTSDGCEVYENVFIECGANPMGVATSTAAMKPGQATKNTKVYRNTIVRPYNGGIFVTNIESILLWDNLIIDPKSSAFSLGAYQSHSTGYEPSNALCRAFNNAVYYTDGFVNTAATFLINGTTVNNGPIEVVDNYIYGGSTLAIEANPVSALPNVVVVRNKIYGNRGSVVARFTNAAGAAPYKPKFVENEIYGVDLTKTTYRVDFIGCDSPAVRKNIFANMGNNAVNLQNCTGDVDIDENIFDGYNVANTNGVAAINVIDTGTTTYNVRKNRVLRGNGNPKALINCNSANPTFKVFGNELPDSSVAVTVNATPTIVADSTVPVGQFGPIRIFVGTEKPASGGPYRVGDLVINTAPDEESPLAWACIAAGSPGTWSP